MPDIDIVFKNVNVITMDPSKPAGNCVVIKQGRISFVGLEQELCNITGSVETEVDCKGKTLLPGFIDAHGHLFSFIRKLVGVDLSPSKVTNISDIKDAIRQRALLTPKGKWIEGTGYNDFYLTEKRHPNRYDLDEAAPDNPVVIAHRSMHSCVLNSMALKLAGISKNTVEKDGTRFERDNSGEPDGLLYEMLGYIREKVMPPINDEDAFTYAKLVNQQLITSGITSLQDASITNDFKRWRVLSNVVEKGILATRLIMAASIETLPSFLKSGISPGYGDNIMKFWGIKIIPSESKGTIYPIQDDLNRMVLDMQKLDYPVLIHAVSKEMVDSVITSFEYVKRNLTKTPLQRIEHCSECSPQLLERLTILKPVIVSQPLFVYYNGDRYKKIIANDKIPWLYRFRSMINCGLTVAAGSDLPVVPQNPITGIYAAVTRKTDTNDSLVPEENISPFQALQMYTLNAAAAASEENTKGSITPGKLADMVVLSDDPLKVRHDEIKNIKVEMTIIGGKVVFCN